MYSQPKGVRGVERRERVRNRNRGRALSYIAANVMYKSTVQYRRANAGRRGRLGDHGKVFLLCCICPCWNHLFVLAVALCSVVHDRREVQYVRYKYNTP